MLEHALKPLLKGVMPEQGNKPMPMIALAPPGY